MKKLLAIIFALCLVMAFSVPVMAFGGTDIDLDDNTAQLGIGNADDQSIADNDLLDIDKTAVDVLNDKSDDDVKDFDNVSDVYNDKSDDDVKDFDNVSDVMNDKSDDDVKDFDNNSDFANDKSQDNDNLSASAGEVAATTGGFAMSLDISDVNLAFTSSEQNLAQGNIYVSGAAAGGGLGGGEAESEFESFSCVDVDVDNNLGITGVNVSGGSFNNQANMSSVNVTVQW